MLLTFAMDQDKDLDHFQINVMMKNFHHRLFITLDIRQITDLYLEIIVYLLLLLIYLFICWIYFLLIIREKREKNDFII